MISWIVCFVQPADFSGISCASAGESWIDHTARGRVPVRAWPWGPVVATFTSGTAVSVKSSFKSPLAAGWSEIQGPRDVRGVVASFQLAPIAPLKNPDPEVPGLVFVRGTRGLGALLRAEPRSNANPVRIIPETSKPFAVSDRNGDWVRAGVSQLVTGWLPRECLHPFYGELADILPKPWTAGQSIQKEDFPSRASFPTLYGNIELPWIRFNHKEKSKPVNESMVEAEPAKLPNSFSYRSYSESFGTENLLMVDWNSGRVTALTENGFYSDPGQIFAQTGEESNKELFAVRQLTFPTGKSSRLLKIPQSVVGTGFSRSSGPTETGGQIDSYGSRGGRLLTGIANSSPARAARIASDGSVSILDTVRCRVETYGPNGSRTGFTTLVSNNFHFCSPGIFTDFVILTGGSMAVFERSCRRVELLNSRGLNQGCVEAMPPDTVLHPWSMPFPGEVKTSSSKLAGKSAGKQFDRPANISYASNNGVMISSVTLGRVMLFDMNGSLRGARATGGPGVPCPAGVAWAEARGDGLVLFLGSLIPIEAASRKNSTKALDSLESRNYLAGDVREIAVDISGFPVSAPFRVMLTDSMTDDLGTLFLALVSSVNSGNFHAVLIDDSGKIRKVSESMSNILLGTGAESSGFRLDSSGTARFFHENGNLFRDVELWEAL
jgi:hypothetical protein